MGQARNWTVDEIDYLQEHWGYTSIKTIAKNINRSEIAVMQKASKLKMGAHLENSQYLSLNQLLLTVGRRGGNAYSIKLLTEKGMKIKKHKVRNCSFRVVEIEEFWRFAELNKDLFDFSRFERNSLGVEPEWATVKRNEDMKKNRAQKQHSDAWTPAEDAELIRLLKLHRYGYAELEQRLRRTAGAIQRRVIDLGVKERPVKAYNHNKWTKEQKDKLKKLITDGSSYSVIALEIGKSTKAIKGKVYQTFGSENLDKVRRRIFSNG
jgi:hypothetical protein